eukprot:1162075-Pelagomonas_calceolata.AAC.6
MMHGASPPHDALQVLDELDMGSIPVVTAWNKADACPDPDQVGSQPLHVCVLYVYACGHGVPSCGCVQAEY